MALYFHNSFRLDRARMAGLLELALENPQYRDRELAKELGYGVPYAQRYRQWLFRTGITQLRLPLKLTEAGKVIYQNDPKLDSQTTQAFMHQQLVTDPVRAETWHFFWFHFLSRHKQFTKSDLRMALTDHLSREHSVEHFGPNSTMTPTIVRLILDCYTADAALGALDLITQTGDSYMRNEVAPEQFASVNDLKAAYQ